MQLQPQPVALYFSDITLSFPASYLLVMITITLQFVSLLLMSCFKGIHAEVTFLSFSENFALFSGLRIVALIQRILILQKKLLELLILNQIIPIPVPYSNGF